MNYTVQNMKEPLVIIIDKKEISLKGYAFIDEMGHCIIIVYGENRRDSLMKLLDTNM
jgi:hypothetical protein